jgi:hypothetical protein
MCAGDLIYPLSADLKELSYLCDAYEVFRHSTSLVLTSDKATD